MLNRIQQTLHRLTALKINVSFCTDIKKPAADGGDDTKVYSLNVSENIVTRKH